MPFLEVGSPTPEEETLPTLRLRQDEAGPSRVAGPGPGARLQQVELKPVPSFVIKTLLLTPYTDPIHIYDYPEGSKLFINVAYAAEVPEQQDEKSLVPCIVSDARDCEDKSGKKSLVIDAILPPGSCNKAKTDKHHKQWLIQVVLERVEEKMICELSRDYAEPNIKSKGSILPRRAVVPVPVGSSTNTSSAPTSKIQIMDDSFSASSDTKPTSSLDSATKISTNTKEMEMTNGNGSGRGKGKMVPKHEFDLREKGTRFVFSLFLPEETASSAAKVELSLSPGHLDFESDKYKLAVDLPMDVDIPSVLEAGTEWSVAEKAIRLKGKVVKRG